jgi:hypothetical protein
MVDYLNGKIYKITNNVDDNIYIGSTIKTLKQRFSNHKSNYKMFLNGSYHNISCFKLFSKYGTDNCFIELIELYPCENKNELEQHESVYINNNKALCVNKNIPGRTVKQKINCECKGKYSYGKKNRHQKTLKHKQYLEHQTINNNNNCNITINNYN